jgi:hypothetical protein
MRVLAAALVLSSFLPGQVPGHVPAPDVTTAGVIDALDPGFSSGKEGKVRIFHIGPYTIPAARLVGTTIVPGEFEQVVPAPSAGDVYMTGFDSRIVDANRIPQDPDLLYLHHAVLVRTGAFDMTCVFMPGERFAAAGAERIPFSLPIGYGYRISANDKIACILHMQNYTMAPKTVYYQYSMTVVPGSIQPPLVNVRPWWLDVKNCTSSYVVPQGTGEHVASADFPVPSNLTILTMGPHLHCGGIKLELFNKTTNQLIHGFPNRRPCPIDMLGVIPTPPIQLTQNTQVTIRATYQRDPGKGLDAMGILLSYVY